MNEKKIAKEIYNILKGKEKYCFKCSLYDKIES